MTIIKQDQERKQDQGIKREKKIKKRREKKRGFESGLDLGYVFKDILSNELYFDPTSSVEELGYKQGGVREAIEATVKVLYPR